MSVEERRLFNKYIYLENTNVLNKLELEKKNLLLDVDLLNREISEIKYFVSDESLSSDEERKIAALGNAFVYERENLTEGRKNRYLIELNNKNARLNEILIRLKEIDKEMAESKKRIENYRLGILPGNVVEEKVDEEIKRDHVIEEENKDDDQNLAGVVGVPEDGKVVNISDEEENKKDPAIGLIPIGDEEPKLGDELKDDDNEEVVLGEKLDDDDDDIVLGAPLNDEEEVINVVAPKKSTWKKVLLAIGGAAAFIGAILGLRSCAINCGCQEKTTEESEQEDDLYARMKAEEEAARKKAEEEARRKAEEDKKKQNPGGDTGYPGGDYTEYPGGETVEVIDEPEDTVEIIDEPAEPEIDEPITPEDEIISEEEITPEVPGGEETIVEEITPEQTEETIVEEITPEGEVISHDEGTGETVTETVPVDTGGETVTIVEEITPGGEVVEHHEDVSYTDTPQEETVSQGGETVTVVEEIPTNQEPVVTVEEVPIYLSQGETAYNIDTGVEVTSSGDTYVHTDDGYSVSEPAVVESTDSGYTVVTQEDFVPHEEVTVEVLPPTGQEVTYEVAAESYSAPEMANLNESIVDFDWGTEFDNYFGDEMTLG